MAGNAAASLAPAIQVVFDPYEALEGVNAAVVVTEWEEVKGLDPKKAASLMPEPQLIVDGRNALVGVAAADPRPRGSAEDFDLLRISGEASSAPQA